MKKSAKIDWFGTLTLELVSVIVLVTVFRNKELCKLLTGFEVEDKDVKQIKQKRKKNKYLKIFNKLGKYITYFAIIMGILLIARLLVQLFFHK